MGPSCQESRKQMYGNLCGIKILFMLILIKCRQEADQTSVPAPKKQNNFSGPAFLPSTPLKICTFHTTDLWTSTSGVFTLHCERQPSTVKCRTRIEN